MKYIENFVLIIFTLLIADNLYAQGTWTQQTSGTTSELDGVYFTDSNNGWAVGKSGLILHTTDGGINWSSQTSGTTKWLHGVYFTDSNNGWAVGRLGTIVYTTDGGNNWNPQTTGTNDWLNDVFLIDINNGWIVGDGGTIFHTIDGGANWGDSTSTSGTADDLYSVYFTDSNNGWMVGEGGTILHTANGGNSWTGQVSGTADILYNVHFTNSNNGWAVGENGTILYTTDGGNNWTSQISGTIDNLYSEYFLDNNNGWAVGDSIILYTTNSGSNWNISMRDTTSIFNSVHFADVDNGWSVGKGGVILKYIPNSPPVLSAIGAQSIDESQLLTITLSASDADGDPLTYSAVNMPTGATFTDSTFSWTPSFSQSGSYDVTFKVSDGLVEDSEVVTITVNDVNQAPVLSAIGAQSVNEGQLLTITLSAADADGDPLSYSAINMPSGASFTDSTFTWTPAYNQSGSYEVTFGVSDGEAADSETIIITVSDVNRSPTITAMTNTSMNEGDTFIRQVIASDPDGDALTYSLTSSPSGMTISGTGEINWTPDNTQSGSHTVTVKVQDGKGGEDSKSFSLTVINVNRAPSINSTPITFASEAIQYSYDMEATDPDGESLTYSLTTAPSGMSINSSTGLITWTPTNSQIGTHNVTVQVSDGDLTDTQSFTISVSEYNRAPVLDEVGDREIDENQTLTITLSATDADGDPLTYSAVNMPSGATFTDNIFSWTPTYNQSGSYEVTFEVSDGKATDSETVTITVNNVSVITAMTNTAMSEGETFTRQVEAADPEGGTLTYSLTSYPSGMTIGSSSGIISWIPNYAQSGTYTITVKVVSTSAVEDAESFILTVNEVHNAPVILSIPGTTLHEGDQYTQQVEVYNPKRETLTYSLVSCPSGMKIGSRSGIISWIPGYDQSGTYLIIIKIVDSWGAEDTESLRLKVYNANGPPEITPMTDVTVTGGDIFTGHVEARDPNDDNLHFSMTQYPDGMSFVESTGKISWSPSNSDIGEHEVTIRVSDGTLANTASFKITVIRSNFSPVMAGINDTTINETQMLSITISAIDGDNDNLTFGIINSPEGSSLNENVFTWTPNYEQAGEYSIIFTVSDGYGGSDLDTVAITVHDINRPPIFTNVSDTAILIDERFDCFYELIDPDGDEINVYKIKGPQQLLCNYRGYTWKSSAVGDFEVILVADDNRGGLDTCSFIITVKSNHPPVLSAIGNRNIDENQTLTIVLSAFDEDGDSLIYSVVNNPSGSILTDSTFTWTPAFSQSGLYDVTFSVSDGQESDSETITIKVTDVENNPAKNDLAVENYCLAIGSEDSNLVKISAEIKNIGDNEVNNFYVKFFIGDSLLNNNAILDSLNNVDVSCIDSIFVNSLKSDSSKIIHVSLFVSSEYTKIFCFVNPEKNIIEENYNNNYACICLINASINLKVKASNLIFSEDYAIKGEKVNVIGKVNNTSSNSIHNLLVKFYDGDPCKGGTLIGSKIIESISPGDEIETEVDFNTSNKNIGIHNIYLFITSEDLLGINCELYSYISKELCINSKKDSLMNISSEISFCEDSVYSIKLSGFLSSDVNINNVTWKIVSGAPIFISLDSSSGLLNITPHKDWCGEEKIIVSLMDTNFNADKDTINLTVLPVNDPPGEFNIINSNFENTTNIIKICWNKSLNIDTGDTIKYDLFLVNTNLLSDTLLKAYGLIDTFYIFDKTIKKQCLEEQNYSIIIYAEDSYGLRTLAANSQEIFITTEVEDIDYKKLPEKYSLFQNYPNPFNNGTNIKFSLPKSENVLLKVYNIQGREIITLANRRISAGNHTIQWDGLNKYGLPAASGIYIYTIRAGRFFQTKKMILLK